MRDLSKARASFDRDLVVLDTDVLTLDFYCLQNEKENHDAVNGHANVRWSRSYHSRSVIWHRPLRSTRERTADAKRWLLAT